MSQENVNEDVQGNTPAEAGDWTQGLPEGLREAGQAAGSLEALGEAIQRGMAYMPVSSAEEVQLPKDAAQLGWIRGAAINAGLSQGQVDALAKDYATGLEQGQAALRQESEAKLRKEYGDKYEAVISKADDTLRRFNQLTGGSLDELIKGGLGSHYGFVKFMAALSEAVSPSALPGSSAGGGPETAISTEAFISDIFKQANT